MITIEDSVDYSTLASIWGHPKVYSATFGKDVPLNQYIFNTQCQYLLIRNDNKPIGIIPYRAFTDTIIEAHLCLLPEAQNRELDKEIRGVFRTLAINKGFMSVITTIPIQCNHAIRFVHKNGFELIGGTEQGIRYNNILQTVLIFELKF